MSLADEKYVALTTYKRDGASTTVPVWIADVGEGRLGFTTGAGTLKAKRLAHDPQVQLQPCNARGAVTAGTVAVAGTAVVAQGDADFERTTAAIKDKYGYQVMLARLYYTVQGLFSKGPTPASDAAVIITTD